MELRKLLRKTTLTSLLLMATATSVNSYENTNYKVDQQKSKYELVIQDSYKPAYLYQKPKGIYNNYR
jgi:hypothetical protein